MLGIGAEVARRAGRQALLLMGHRGERRIPVGLVRQRGLHVVAVETVVKPAAGDWMSSELSQLVDRPVLRDDEPGGRPAFVELDGATGNLRRR